MVRWRFIVGALAVSGVVLGLFGAWRGTRPSPVEPRPGEAVRAPPPSAVNRWLALPVPAPRGALSIRGTVVGPDGPVPGAWVVAAPSTPASAPPGAVPCGCEPGSEPDEAPSCGCGESTGRWLEDWTSQAPPLARAIADAQGRFTLEGLEAGRFDLWSQHTPGAVLRREVEAGDGDVELRLGPGATLALTVSDEGGLPVAGARAALFLAARDQLLEGVTGEDGRLWFGALPEGEYLLVVLKDGKAPEATRLQATEAHALEVTLFRPRRLEGRVSWAETAVAGAEVHLRGILPLATARTDAGGRFSFEGLHPGDFYELTTTHGGHEVVRYAFFPPDMDFPEVVMDLAVPSFLHGAVRDEAGRPIPGATVEARGHDVRAVLGDKVRARTKADGTYVLGPLPPLTYAFEARAEGFLSDHGDGAAGTRTLDFVLRQVRVLEGRVVDEAGLPVAGASVGLREGAGDVVGSWVEEGGWAESGEDGAFRLRAYRSGRFQVAASHPDFKSARVDVTVPGRDVRLVLSPGAELTGEVVDARGTPLAGARVALQRGAAGARWVEASADTDARGRFSLRGLEAGRYAVSATHGQDEDQRVAAPVDAEVAERAEARVRLVVLDGLPVAGSVVDTAGQPVPDAFVSLRPEPGENGRVGGPLPHVYWTVRSGQDGRFSARYLPPGRYSLRASKEGYDDGLLEAFAQGRDDWKPIVEAGALGARVVLRRNPRAHGRVTREDGTPVTRFLLNGRLVVDDEGRFSWPLPRERDWPLVFFEPSLAPASRTLRAQPGGADLELGTVVLRAGHPLRGRVTDAATGAPVEGALVAVEDGPAESKAWADLFESEGAVKTNVEGGFLLPHVEEGAPTLVVTHPHYLQRRLALEPRQAQARVVLDSGARVRGRVRASPSYSRFEVRLEAEDGSSSHEVRVRGGSFEFRGVPPGAYLAFPRAWPRPEPRATFLPRRVVVPARGTVTLDFEELRVGATLRLRSVAEPAVAHYRLVPGEVALPEDGTAFERATRLGHRSHEEGGHEVFRLLPGGTYTLFAVRYPKRPERGVWVHREVMTLPASGEVPREVSPVWKRLEDSEPAAPHFAR